MKNNIWFITAIHNAVCIICFTVLATVFRKWWIALFSILFMLFVNTKPIHYYFRTCDKCGEQSEYANTPDEALDKAIKSGWLHIAYGNKDYCPKCKYNIKR